jgi:hypothetical protein
MTAPALLTPQQVVAQLSELGRQLDAAVVTLRTAETDAALLRHAADIAEAKAFVAAEGPVDLRKRLALLAVATEEDEALVAEATLRWLRSRIRAIDTRIEVGRSYGAAVRAELKALDYPEAP